MIGADIALLTLDPADGFRLDESALAGAIAAHRADLLFVGSPNNPAGTVPIPPCCGASAPPIPA